MTTDGWRRVFVSLMLEAPETERRPDAGYSSQTLAVKKTSDRRGAFGWPSELQPPHLSYQTPFSSYWTVNSQRASQWEFLSPLLVQRQHRVQHLGDAQAMFATRVKKGRNN